MHVWFQKALDLVHPARSVTQVRRSAEEQRAADQAAGPLTLYHFRSCPHCLRVRRAVHRLNIPIALRDIHIDPAAHRALLAGGGRQTVPCLYIDDPAEGTWLYESADIIDYLNRRFAPARGSR
ncbi:glutathione S-transferase N-terminal domain-containing protein [Salinisphaera sp. LB1]|uniref:glutaredoxin family protein n=1 Tax=Salinisphaera sp. LB1 TaxID=2183911 RepID=UPI000D705AF3|nr:glutathione S-transferase N-terminal domain-containing protein [Salinisphaera sp. LB1]AWN14441.1 Glutaredoxin [Salinisphaera sp. LB1]